MKTFTVVAVFMVLAVALTACGGGAAPAAGEPARAATAAVQVAEAAASNTTLAAPPTSTPTQTPEPTATATPLPTVTPTTTATPTATPEPPLQAIRLTDGGCCTQPFWSPDSQQVRFIDQPAADQPVGIYGVSVAAPLAAPLAAPQFVTARLEESTASPRFLIETSDDATVIERRSDGERWTVPAGGRNVLISPDETRIAWAVTNSDAPSSSQVTTLWLANLDGSDAQQIATLPRGGLSGWIDGDTLLISGRDSQEAREQVLSAYKLADGSRTELVRAERLRGQVLSPGGGWLVYYITFDVDPAKNGLWVVRTDGGQSIQLGDDLFGSYQWRPCAERCAPADDRLLIVPMQLDAPLHRLVELNPATGEVRQLTDPAVTPFKIANGDWRISPDGSHMAFVESRDRNIWVIELAER